MSKPVTRKVKAWASVGTHGHIYSCMSSPHPQLVGRMEIFDNETAANRMALSPKHAVEVTVTYEWNADTRDGDA